MSSYFKIGNRLQRQFCWRLEPCAIIIPLVSQSLDRSLSLNERVRVTLHLLACAWCKKYLNQIRLIRNLLRVKDDHQYLHPEVLGNEAREKIKRALRTHS